MAISLKDTLRQPRPLIGTLVTTASPEIAEALALSGFDWLFIDLEHGSLSILDAQRAVQAVAGRCFTVVRVPDTTPENIKRVLDTGCDGIIAPHVNSAEEARTIVRLAKYPPEGERSVGLARAHGYGASFAEYIATANERIAIIVQIEHKNAVANVDEIAAVQGIDSLFIGPFDLSGSMGLLGKVSDPNVVAAIDKVRAACAAAKLPMGIFSPTTEHALSYITSGARVIAVGTDLTHMTNAARGLLQSIR